jgi:hypothetical protein
MFSQGDKDALLIAVGEHTLQISHIVLTVTYYVREI